jgi:hypothetical protein
MPHRFSLKLVTLILFLSVLQGSPAQAVGSTFTIKTVQSGEVVKLSALWSIVGSVEGSTISVIDSKGKSIHSYKIPTKGSFGGRKGNKDFTVKAAGKYLVKLTRSKGGKFVLSKNFTVIGLNPTILDALTINSEGLRVEWHISSEDTFRKVDSFRITLYQDKFVYQVLSIGDSNYLVIDTKIAELVNFNFTKSFSVGMQAINKAGSTSEFLLENKVIDEMLAIFEKAIMTQEKAGEIFGGFAILNRGAIGVVNFNDNEQVKAYPVPAALTKCLVESSGIGFTGIANLGGVFASRSPGLVFLITSGVSKFKERLELDILQKDTGLMNCVKAPLTQQANLIASTLAPGSSVLEPVFSQGVSSELIANTTSFTLNGVYDKEIPIVVVWSVKHSLDGALVQYFYIKSGAGIDASTPLYINFLKA